ncbi:MAG: cytochrome C [Desulfuromonas sp.]|nr:cytochrome C [Desulfuromonas sp.]
MKRLCLSTALVVSLLWVVQPCWSMETEDCLACHTEAEDVGEENAINGQLFAVTAHAEEGCTACHEVGDEHPDDGQETGMAATCADCHDGIDSQYSASAHSANASCTECHDVHQALPTAKVSGLQMNAVCSVCHDSADVEESHSAWLPEADLHLRSAACVTCHSSAEKFAVSMYVSQREGNDRYADFVQLDYQQLKQFAGDKSVETLIDADQNGEVSMDEMSAFYSNNERSGLRLWAMMTPDAVGHDFKAMENRADCTYCHSVDPEVMDNSFISLPQQDGTYKLIQMEKGSTLHPLFGTPDFYMVGASRNKIMNILGLLILLGGMALPVGHGTMRLLTRKNRRKEH